MPCVGLSSRRTLSLHQVLSLSLSHLYLGKRERERERETQKLESVRWKETAQNFFFSVIGKRWSVRTGMRKNRIMVSSSKFNRKHFPIKTCRSLMILFSCMWNLGCPDKCGSFVITVISGRVKIDTVFIFTRHGKHFRFFLRANWIQAHEMDVYAVIYHSTLICTIIH